MSDLSLHMRLTADADDLQNELHLGRRAIEGFNESAHRTEGAGDRARRGMNAARDALAGVRQSANGAVEASSRLNQGVAGLVSRLGKFTRLSALVELGKLAVAGAKLAEKYSGLQAQIRLATEATNNQKAASAALYEVSQRNGVAFGKTVELFTRVNGTAESLGRSTAEAVELTEAVQQIGAIGGASTEQMATATKKLTSGLAGGVLTVKQFNGIAENTPVLAEQIAEGMGMTVGQLRQAVKEGRILSDDVFSAVLNQSDSVAAAMSEMPARMDRGWQRLINSGTRFLGIVNNAAGGITSQIGRALNYVGGLVDTVSDAVKSGWAFDVVAAYTATWRDYLSDAYDWLTDLIGQGGNLSRIWSIASKVAADYFQYVLDAPLYWDAAMTTVIAVMDRTWITVKDAANSAWVALKLGWLSLGRQVEIVAETIRMAFGRAMDTVLNNLASTLTRTAEMVSDLPLTDSIVSQINKAASAVRDYASFESAAKKDARVNESQYNKKVDEVINSHRDKSDKYQKEIRASKAAEQAAWDSVAAAKEQREAALKEANARHQATQAAIEQSNALNRVGESNKKATSATNESSDAQSDYCENLDAVRESSDRAADATDRYSSRTKGAAEEAERLNKAHEKVPELAQEAATGIQGAFEDTFRDVLKHGIDSFDKLGDRIKGVFKGILDKLKGMLVEQLTTAFSRPFVVPVVGMMSDVMGLSKTQTQNLFGQLGVTGSSGGGASLLAGVGNAYQGFMSGQNVLYSAGSSFGRTIATSGVGQWAGLSQPASMYAGHPAMNGATPLTSSGRSFVSGMGTAATVGGGLLAAYGAYQSADPAMGAGTGAMYGAAVAGGVGAAIGAVVGAILGALGQNGQTDPRIRFKNEKEGTPSTAFEDDVSVNTPFGEVGLANATHKTDAEDYKPLLNGLATFDRIIEEIASKGEVEKAANAVKGWHSSIKEWDDFEKGDLTKLLQERYRVVFDELKGHTSSILEEFTLGFEGSVDKFIARVTTLGQSLQGVSEALEDPERAQTILGRWAEQFEGDNKTFDQQAQGMVASLARIEGYNEQSAATKYQADKEAASQSLRELYQEQMEKAREAAESYDTSYESTVELGNQVQALRQRELQMIQAIDGAQQAVSQGLKSSAEQIRTDLMSEGERYDYLRNKAEGLAETLSSMSDPAKIAQTTERIRTLTMQGYNLLDDGQKEKMGEELASFLDEIDATASARLEAVRNEVKGNSQSFGDVLDVVAGAAASGMAPEEIKKLLERKKEIASVEAFTASIRALVGDKAVSNAMSKGDSRIADVAEYLASQSPKAANDPSTTHSVVDAPHAIEQIVDANNVALKEILTSIPTATRNEDAGSGVEPEQGESGVETDRIGAVLMHTLDDGLQAVAERYLAASKTLENMADKQAETVTRFGAAVTALMEQRDGPVDVRVHVSNEGEVEVGAA